MTKAKMAQESDWKNHPMPKEQKNLFCEQVFTPAEYEKLQFGFVPEAMEDKWFIYFEDDKLYFHRSWTGYCIYIVEFESNDKHSQITKVTVNRDTTQYKETDNRWDLEFVVYLINLLLLNKHLPYPEKKGVNPETSALQQWSQVGRAMIGDEE